MAVTFKNNRFDPKFDSFHETAEEMAKAVGYTAKLSIDAKLAQLLRLRVAQVNPCSYCLILHTRTALERGISPEKVAQLPSWRESTLFSENEQAALAYCEALTRYDLSMFADCHKALAKHFDVAVVEEIAAVVINMNVWTRLKLAQGAVPVEG